MPNRKNHTDVISLVKEIFHEWQWGVSPEFRKDVESKSSFEFAIKFHETVGKTIRNEYGLTTKNSELYNHFVSIGITEPDEMSHKVFVELHKFAREEFKINESTLKQKKTIFISMIGFTDDYHLVGNSENELNILKITFIKQLHDDGVITTVQAKKMNEYIFKLNEKK